MAVRRASRACRPKRNLLAWPDDNLVDNDPLCPVIDIVPPIWQRDFSSLSLGAGATFTRASVAYYKQPGGMLQECLAHEARFAGARRVANRLRSSLNLANQQYWIRSNNPVITEGIDDPFGGNNAIRLASPTQASGRIAQGMYPSQVVGAYYGVTVWLRRVSGTGNFRIYPTNAVADIPGAGITSTWKKFFGININGSGGAAYVYLQVMVQGDEFDVYFPSGGIYSSISDQPVESVLTGIASSAELVVNGGFDTDTIWTKGTGWTITGGTAVGTATTGNLELPIGSFAPKIGKTYRVEFDLTVTSGTVRAYVGGTACGGAVSSATGHVVVYGIAANTTGPFYIDGVTSFTGKIDNVSIKECDSYGTNVDGVRYFNTTCCDTYNSTTKLVTERRGAALAVPFTSLREPAMTNHLLNSSAPVTQTTGSLSTGTYTLWVEGTGSALASAGTATITGAAAASAGSHNTFDVTVAGTVTVTVTGTLTKFQLEKSAKPTSFILTAGAEAVRAVDALSYAGVPVGNETRIDTVPDPDVDIDYWDGVMPTPMVPINEAGVKAYSLGGRPPIPVYGRYFHNLSLGADDAFTRASTAFHTQPSGVLIAALTHEARFTKARREVNLIRSSENFRDRAWTPGNGTITVGVSDPLGGNNAATFTATSANGTLRQVTPYAIPVQTGLCASVGVSVWIRRRTGTGGITLYNPASSVTITGLVTGTWQRIFLYTTTLAPQWYLGVAVSGDAVDIFRPMISAHDSATPLPPEYIPTGVPTGLNLAPNGTFDTDTIYTKGTGWTIAGGVAVATATTGDLTLPLASFTPVIGRTYRVSFDLVLTSGVIRGPLQPANASWNITVGGSITYVEKCTVATAVTFDGVTSFTGTIDNLVIQECLGPASADGVEYFGTANGNTVASNIVTEATGAALTGPFTLFREPVATNDLIQSNDLSLIATWNKLRLTSALTATGPNGAVNTASTLTATAAYGWVYQPLVKASAQRALSFFLKRRTGTGQVLATLGVPNGAEMISNGTFNVDATGWTASSATLSIDTGRLKVTSLGSTQGTAYLVLTTIVGQAYRITATLGDGDSGANAARISIGTAVASTNLLPGQYLTTTTAAGLLFVASTTTTYINLQNYNITNGLYVLFDNISVMPVAMTPITVPAAWAQVSALVATVTNPLSGLILETSGDAIDVWCAQNEVGAQVTGPAPTTTAAVTRAVDALSYAGTPVINEGEITYSTGLVKIPNLSALPVPTAPENISKIEIFNSGHWNLGPELITNGTFDTDASGWTAQNSSVLSVTGGQITVTNLGGNFGQAVQTINLEIGASYLMRAQCVATTGPAMRVFWDLTNAIYLYNLTTPATPAAIFVATGASTIIALRNGTATAPGATTYDNVSVRKILS